MFADPLAQIVGKGPVGHDMTAHAAIAIRLAAGVALEIGERQLTFDAKTRVRDVMGIEDLPGLGETAAADQPIDQIAMDDFVVVGVGCCDQFRRREIASVRLRFAARLTLGAGQQREGGARTRAFALFDDSQPAVLEPVQILRWLALLPGHIAHEVIQQAR